MLYNQYIVKVTDEEFIPIDSTVTYKDVNGSTVGSEHIPAGVSFALSDTLLHHPDTFDLEFASPGYYDFSVIETQLADFSDITLQRKPSQGIEAIAGAAILAILAFFYK